MYTLARCLQTPSQEGELSRPSSTCRKRSRRLGVNTGEWSVSLRVVKEMLLQRPICLMKDDLRPGGLRRCWPESQIIGDLGCKDHARESTTDTTQPNAPYQLPKQILFWVRTCNRSTELLFAEPLAQSRQGESAGWKFPPLARGPTSELMSFGCLLKLKNIRQVCRPRGRNIQIPKATKRKNSLVPSTPRLYHQKLHWDRFHNTNRQTRKCVHKFWMKVNDFKTMILKSGSNPVSSSARAYLPSHD